MAEDTNVLIKYRRLLGVSLSVMMSSIVAFGIYTFNVEKQKILSQAQYELNSMAISIEDKLRVTQSHAAAIRSAIESGLEHPDRLDTLRSNKLVNSTHTPWESLSDIEQQSLGSLIQALPIRDRIDMVRKSAAVISAMPFIIANHNLYEDIKWTYFYDKSGRWWIVYPPMSKKSLLLTTNTKTINEAVVVVFNADGTFPLEFVNPINNPERIAKITRPYKDTFGAGNMVTLLTPVYANDVYEGAIGVNITLEALSSIVTKRTILNSPTYIISGGDYVVGDNQRIAESMDHLTKLGDIYPGKNIDNLEHRLWLKSFIRGTKGGHIIMKLEHNQINLLVLERLTPFFSALFLVVIICSTLMWLQQRRYVTPAMLLAKYVDDISKLSAEIPKNIPSHWLHWFEMVRDVEIERRQLLKKMQSHADLLESAVKERTEELRIKITELQRAEHELLRSERMAGLGSMVAGIAHEINTPIGNALLVSSTLKQHYKDMNNLYVSNLMKKTNLEEFLQNVYKASEILERNLNTTANLVTRFKEVAVDQTNEEIRVFSLHDIVDNNIVMLHPTLKKFPDINVVNDIEPGLRLNSYPGAIGQIVTNLINNAVIHGFSNDQNSKGTIHISAVKGTKDENDGIYLYISDTGKGIDSKIIGRIFDPFFTTKMGSGGTGLGLSIVMNIISNILNGEIKVECANSKTTFTIWIPFK